ncbi:MAG: signal peptidase I [Reyranella sp.]|uniref:signal peptidase I n=1 Tax=Reyranella sp. TaxID=1929291 RepID=UPI001ACE5072|nr:signal peptidase I [Reyranella sp.]MBN9090124.1 signal peptidase I [Reyranella sp.]
MKNWARELRSVAVALGCVLLVRTVVAEPYSVPSGSMVPTLLVGDELIGAKFAYGYGKYSSPIGLLPDFTGRLFDRPPERGDVVVFRLPRDPSQTYVKRLIGLPGDRIQMKQGRLYINDALVPRRKVGAYGDDSLYVETLPISGGGGHEHEIVEISDSERQDDTPVFTVPAGHYFMMGDNRDNSLDSRVAAERGGVGFVPEENLVARADRLLLSRDTSVGWLDVAEWPHAFRLARFLGRIE